MRRVVGFVLLGLGVFAVALGLLLRFYAFPQLAKVPLDNETLSVAEGVDITALVVESEDGVPVPEVRDHLSLKSTTYVTGDLTKPEVRSDGDVAVYVEAIRTEDQASHIVVNASVRSLCFDRHTGEAVAPCEGQYIETQQGERETANRNTVQQPGLSFKFPFGAEQHDYGFYDLQVRKAVTAKFDGEDTVQGLDTYRYVMQVGNTKIGEREVPGSLVGLPEEPLVKASLYYTGKRTLWVEPVTGVIVLGQQEMTQELVPPGEKPGDGTVVFDGTLRLNDATVNDNVGKANDAMGQIRLLTTWPIFMWIGGAVLALAGLAMLFLRRGADGSGPVDGSPPRHRQPVGASG
ncbi:DUF3068 domain-containing protein [Actinophytocola oryzae]|uniref:DUF3068 family protein n=1 Tax=Actinophytocola oryzae TaxID=502181 RepID=A0A4R7UZR9_9PSEU|nr:DUF3068 domain-containing protein [Actinophytocola oryzae]TDV41764.1 Protein of unknown function (DUF3068) [Actinophytocola oryzae]